MNRVSEVARAHGDCDLDRPLHDSTEKPIDVSSPSSNLRIVSTAKQPEQAAKSCPLGILLDLTALINSTACDLREQVEIRTREAGLNETSFRLLWRVQQAPGSEGVSQIELARELHISTAQTSSLVEANRKRGLIKGHRPLSDRRRQHWQLTKKGKTLLDSLLPELEPWASQLLDEQGDNLALLEQLLRQLLPSTETDDEAGPRILPTPAAVTSTDKRSTSAEKRGAA